MCEEAVITLIERQKVRPLVKKQIADLKVKKPEEQYTSDLNRLQDQALYISHETAKVKNDL